LRDLRSVRHPSLEAYPWPIISRLLHIFVENCMVRPAIAGLSWHISCVLPSSHLAMHGRFWHAVIKDLIVRKIMSQFPFCYCLPGQRRVPLLVYIYIYIWFGAHPAHKMRVQ
jgi:hypothetical protein